MRWSRCIHLVFAVLLSLIGSADAQYFRNRYRDALDVLTLQVGYGLGGKARVGPLQTGLLVDVGTFGLRGGDLLTRRDFWPSGHDIPAKVDLVGAVVGAECFQGSELSRRRRKGFVSRQIAVISLPRKPSEQATASRRVEGGSVPYCTQIEVVAAAGPSLRLGFNPGELVDFILGWLRIDLFHDDLGESEAGNGP